MWTGPPYSVHSRGLVPSPIARAQPPQRISSTLGGRPRRLLEAQRAVCKEGPTPSHTGLLGGVEQ